MIHFCCLVFILLNLEKIIELGIGAVTLCFYVVFSPFLLLGWVVGRVGKCLPKRTKQAPPARQTPKAISPWPFVFYWGFFIAVMILGAAQRSRPLHELKHEPLMSSCKAGVACVG